MEKVIIIGLDGATWTYLLPLISKYKLKSLEDLRNNGSSGILESVIPPVTGPAWVSFATGKKPDKHKCFDFAIPDQDLDNLKLMKRSDIKDNYFYEIIEFEQGKSIIINMPVSCPPKMKGICIGGIDATSDFIFPHELISENPELKKYRVVPEEKYRIDGKIKEYIEDILDVEKKRFECAKKLFLNYDWNIFFYLFSGTDWLHHVVHFELDSESAEEKYPNIKDIFTFIDDLLTWFSNNKPGNAYFFIISDHGFKVYNGTFFINRWLIEKGYLQIRPSSEGKKNFRAVIEAEAAKKKKVYFRLPLFLYKFEFLAKLIPLFTIVKKILPLEINMNYIPLIEKTMAYCPTNESRSVYINLKTKYHSGTVSNIDYENIRDAIIKDLSIKEFSPGRNIFKNIYKREEIYPNTDKKLSSPDIILVENEYNISAEFYPSIFGEKPFSNHDQYGIFIASGQGIKQDFKIENAKIYDLAPTILHIFGLPIPDDMDGRVLTEIFEEDSELAKRKPIYVDPGYYEMKQEKERIKSKIRDLRIHSQV